MKLTPLLPLTLAASMLAITGCHTPSQQTDTAAELFNGKDLSGWQCVFDDPAATCGATWSVRDGTIVCTGKPLGVLQTTRTFKNFRLIVEYRWAPGQSPGNSGLLTRINGPARALPRCAEVQLQHGNAGDVLGLQGMTVAAGQPRFFAVQGHKVAGDIAGVKKFLNAENPAGEWNRVELLARNGAYQVWVNGQKVNEATGVELIAGPIGLQSEGGEIQFRRVTLTKLGE